MPRSKYAVNQCQWSVDSEETDGSQHLTNPPFIHDFVFVNRGQHSVCALGDGSICVIDSSNGSCISRSKGHEGMVTNIDSNSAKFCITGGVDKIVQIWKLSDDGMIQSVGRFQHSNKINTIRSIKTDPTIIASDSDALNNFLVTDNSTGEIYVAVPRGL